MSDTVCLETLLFRLCAVNDLLSKHFSFDLVSERDTTLREISRVALAMAGVRANDNDELYGT